MTWANDVRRANETLDWIEARQGPLKLDGYARIETDVRTVRAMAEGQGADERVQEIRARHVAEDTPRGQECRECGSGWPCDTAVALARLDALASEASDVARENETLIEEVKAAGEQIAALAAERDAWKALAEDRETRLGQAVRDTTTMTKAAHDRKKERDAAVARAERAESERDVYRDALTLISRGVWMARNSVESIVWGAREALKKGAALAAASEGE